MTLSECAAWLRARDNFLIITHRRPDGDTLGSAAALARALQSLGKTAYVLENPETTPRYLPFVRELHAPDDYAPDFVISVDIAALDLFPQNANIYRSRVALCIDHHPSNSLYSKDALVDHTRAACGELIFELISLLGDLDVATATALYVAVSTDTGCFSYDNTTANTFYVASKLAEAGAPVAELNRVLFRAKSRGRIAIEGVICSQMEFFYGNRAAVVIITNEMTQRAGADEDDLDNVAAIPVSVAGVEVGVTIRELAGPFDCKVSVRSAPGVNSNDVCARFGGGGHSAAAGFARHEAAEKIKDRIVAVLADFLPGDPA
ncbi:MAG: DHH family phosphoesterase [Oscillospiraceae bacterium]|jgi:phosphoesterase RecJ-like protein|nr:DHH family phosphoesterase [Oscillospiraceae bacterium]